MTPSPIRCLLRSAPVVACALAICALAIACGSPPARSPDPDPASKLEPPTPGGELRLRGTVRHVGVEGGCWRLETDDGRGFELHRGQAPPEVLVDGAVVRLVARRRDDLMSLCQVGPILEVVRVEAVTPPGGQ
ncbi:MAG TPA: hypothetical protein VNK43_01810 [Gemmatimonadales bacterium]|nr:hypothetical protein [Gemmatimonadales bacterium]